MLLEVVPTGSGFSLVAYADIVEVSCPHKRYSTRFHASSLKLSSCCYETVACGRLDTYRAGCGCDTPCKNGTSPSTAAHNAFLVRYKHDDGAWIRDERHGEYLSAIITTEVLVEQPTQRTRTVCRVVSTTGPGQSFCREVPKYMSYIDADRVQEWDLFCVWRNLADGKRVADSSRECSISDGSSVPQHCKFRGVSRPSLH